MNVSEQASGVTEVIIGAAIEVHKHLGPGLLESAYEQCLFYELVLQKRRVARQVELPVLYKSVHLDCGYRLDLVIDDLVVVEVKAVESLIPIHEAQLLTYLRLSRYPVGLLINFHVPLLKHGIRRLVQGLNEQVR